MAITTPLHRALLATMLVATTAMLSACNTTEGAGKDVERTGEAVQDTAKDVKRKM
jgi:predicted small secreted protein